jgi:uncharacterized protein (TIGR02996 family)
MRRVVDDAAFLRAVCEAPYDDGPRLVYADALDERGDVRGEFIRAQCGLARLGFNGPLTIRTARIYAVGGGLAQHPFADRAARLLSEYATAWCQGFGVGAATAYEWGWSRGLVAAVTMTAEQFLGVAAALFAQAPVEEMRLSDREPEDLSGYGFGWAGHKESIEDAPHRIPWTIWKLLSNSLDDSRLPPWRFYPTHDAAVSALSAAYVGYGRSLVRPPLPPLTRTPATEPGR